MAAELMVLLTGIFCFVAINGRQLYLLKFCVVSNVLMFQHIWLFSEIERIIILEVSGVLSKSTASLLELSFRQYWLVRRAQCFLLSSVSITLQALVKTQVLYFYFVKVEQTPFIFLVSLDYVFPSRQKFSVLIFLSSFVYFLCCLAPSYTLLDCWSVWHFTNPGYL